MKKTLIFLFAILMLFGIANAQQSDFVDVNLPIVAGLTLDITETAVDVQLIDSSTPAAIPADITVALNSGGEAGTNVEIYGCNETFQGAVATYFGGGTGFIVDKGSETAGPDNVAVGSAGNIDDPFSGVLLTTIPIPVDTTYTWTVSVDADELKTEAGPNWVVGDSFTATLYLGAIIQ